MDKVAVLIPCYNEAQTIEKVVRDFQRVFPENSTVYVYDNNSTDGTAEIAAKAGAVGSNFSAGSLAIAGGAGLAAGAVISALAVSAYGKKKRAEA